MDPVAWEQDTWARYRANQAKHSERERLAEAGPTAPPRPA